MVSDNCYMNKNLNILAGVLFFVFGIKTEALEVVYPSRPEVKTSASSIFFVGNANKDANLILNGEKVKVWDNGSFVQVVALNEGKNRFLIEEHNSDENKKLEYIVEKVKNVPNYDTSSLNYFDKNIYNYATVVNNNTPFRANADENAKRVTHLPKGTMVRLVGEKGNYYLVSLSDDENVWVKKADVVNYLSMKEPIFAAISDISVSDDKLYDYIKINLDMQVPYKIEEIDGGLNFKIYGVHKNIADNKILNEIGNVKNVAITTSLDKVTTLFIDLNSKLWGYDCFYSGNDLIVKIRKEPVVDVQKPLNGLTIAVDAGHGRSDYGSVGPTRVKESELNLDIAKKLKKELENCGATVVLTRDDDTDVPLYDRPKKAIAENALIMVSIHANALPDGADPYQKHGTSVFYYNRESEKLAQTLKEQLIKDLGTKDDGTSKASFVLTRPSMPLSVLVEVAYMIHPTEYSLLLDEKFRTRAAVSIKNALQAYVLENASHK